MSTILNACQNDNTSSTSLNDWITPSILENIDSEVASYWGEPNYNVVESNVYSPIQSPNSDYNALANDPGIMAANDAGQSMATAGHHSFNVGITVSPVFVPVSTLSGGERPPTDLILLTVDFMVFHVDEATLCESSSNNFGGFLPVPSNKQLCRVAYLPSLLSRDLHVILQAIYDIPLNRSHHTFWNTQAGIESIICGINFLPQYGVDPRVHVHPRSNVHKHLLTCAALYPLDVFALASQHDINDLAVAASSHLLSVKMDPGYLATSGKIEPGYLRRLFRLLEERKSLLAKLIATEPGLHDSTKKCGFVGQGALKEAWNEAAMILTGEMHGAITTSMIKETFLRATAQIDCRDCIKARDNRLRAICAEWALAPRTI
ncbi:hypothetical protein VNI00_014445 [Paramarasmius palmivorus]|uniref:Uncharacterized protein n=1 Tax=Paramarasmius palmivorus TaxID=297713 RepID=A0AAW0BSE6_9AGAR